MDTFLKLATTTMLAVGLNLFGAATETPFADSNSFGKMIFNDLDSQSIQIAEFEPKPSPPPDKGEDAGTHSWKQGKEKLA